MSDLEALKVKKLAPSVRAEIKRANRSLSSTFEATVADAEPASKTQYPLDSRGSRSSQSQGDRAGIKVSLSIVTTILSDAFLALVATIIHPESSFTPHDSSQRRRHCQDLDCISLGSSYTLLILPLGLSSYHNIPFNAQSRPCQSIFRPPSSS